MMETYTPFDFIKSVSETKKDLVKESDYPEEIEKQYNPFLAVRGLSFFQDTILHANEMNRAHSLFKEAQYRYFLGVLRPRKRFSKWHKLEKDDKLNMIQKYYGCNVTVAKQYMNLLSDKDIEMINNKTTEGGQDGKNNKKK
jgi:hypothetical protein